MSKFLFRGSVLLLLALLGAPSFAQVSDYTFSASSGTFDTLVSGTRISAIESDDDLSATISIGFNFTYEGVVYTKLKASSNGFIQMDTTKTSSRSSNDLDGVNEPILAPLWDDLDGRATGGSKASYLLSGTAPNRVFTMEWKDWEWRYLSSSPIISFQVKLYEGTNKIEFVYDPSATSPSSPSASIGLCGAGTGSGTYLSLDGTGTAPNASSTSETTTLSTAPAAGQVYAFTPPTCKAPVNPLLIDLSSTSTEVIWANTGHIGDTFLLEYGTSGFTQGTGTVVVDTVKALGSFTTLTGLTPTTHYDVYVKHVCAPGDTSGALGFSFRTDIVAPYLEDFESVVANRSGVTYNNFWWATNSADPKWTSQVSSNSGKNSSTTGPIYDNTKFGTAGGFYMFLETTGGSTGDQDTLTSDYIDVSPLTTPFLKYYYHMYGADMGKLYVDIQDSNGVWSLMDSVIGQQQTTEGAAWESNTLELPSVAGHKKMRIRFRGEKGSGYRSDMSIDDVSITEKPNIDLAAEETYTLNSCLSATEPVYVVIKNNLTNTLQFATNNTTVGVNISGAATANLNVTLTSDSLPAGDTMHVNLGTANLSATGSYDLKGYVNVLNDGDGTNDTASVITVVQDSTYAVPQEVDFTNFNGSNLATLFSGWSEQKGETTPSGTTGLWNNGNTTQQTGLGAQTAKVNLYTTNRDEWIVSPKMTVVATDSLYFDAAVTNYNNAGIDSMGTDDSVIVKISTDCGSTWSDLFVMSRNNNEPSNALTSYKLALGAYAGQTIIVAFKAQDGPVDDANDYDFHITNIFIETPPSKDFSVIAFIEPEDFCGNDSTAIRAVVRNEGIVAQTNVGVTANITGAATTTLTATVASLAPEKNDTILLGYLNTLTGGIYNLEGYTTLAADEDNSNDTLRISNIEFGAIPGAPSANNITVCAGSDSMIIATAGNAGYRWYASDTGSVALSNTDTLSLTNVLAADTFYVETFTSSSANVGAADNAIGSSGTFTTFSVGLIFDVVNPIVLDSVTVYAGNAGNVVVRLVNSSGVTLQTATVAVTGNSAGERIAVGFNIAPGTDYKLDAVGSTVSNLQRNSAGAVYPYSDANNNVSIKRASNSLSGYYYFFYDWKITANGCPSERTMAIVNVNPTPVFSLGNDTAFCAGTTFSYTLDATTSGATYKWNDGSNMATLTATAAQTYWCEVTNTNGCSATDTVVISTNALPTINFGNPANVCANADSITLSGATPMGGVYSGTNVVNGKFIPKAAGVGVDTLYYTYTDANNCVNMDSAIIAVDTVPVLSTTSMAAICIGAPAVNLTFGLPTGGTYAGQGVNAGMFNSANGVLGNNLVVYSYTDANNCTDSIVDTVKVVALPTVTLAAIADVCENAPSFSLTGGAPSGGTYSGKGVSTGMYNPATTGAGSDTITYVFTDANNCVDSATVSVTINAKPVVTQSAISAVCENAPAFNVSGGMPTGGTYSGFGINAGVFNPIGAGAGTGNVTYTFTNTDNCTDSASVSVTVNAKPNVTLADIVAVCENAPSFNFTGGMPTGGTYELNGTVATSFDPAVAGVGSDTLFYKFTDANNCADSAVHIFKVEAAPKFNITGDTTGCGPKGLDLQSSLAGMVYTWSTNAKTASINVKQSGQVWLMVTDTNTVQKCASRDTVNITYEAECLSVAEALANTSVNYFPNPNNGTFNYRLAGFEGMEVNLTIVNVNGQTVYQNTWNNVAAEQEGIIELDAVETGIYFINLTTNKGNVMHRMVITK